MKKSFREPFQVRLSEADIRRLTRNGKPMSTQLRDDIALVAALEDFMRDGMSNRELGAMFKLAEKVVES
jgi:hypothetical protein